MRENVGPLLNGERALMTKDMEMADVQNAFLASVTALPSVISGSWETGEKVWKKGDLP